jgi:glucuronate isomerase
VASSHQQPAAPPLALHKDRFFNPDPAVRRMARALHEETSALPIVSPHGHVDARIFAENAPFEEPTSLIIAPDHYVIRMLYSRGVPMEALGIAPADGAGTAPANGAVTAPAVEADPRKVWQLVAEHYFLFLGTPSGAWLDHELHEVFGVRERLTGETAARIYDEILEKLQSPEFLPRALFGRFNIEVLATTDGASDTLAHHRALRESGWAGRVIPTFRPDALFAVASPPSGEGSWRAALGALAHSFGAPIPDYSTFVRALETRRAFFKQTGATATDHGVVEPYTERLSVPDVDTIFQRALRAQATPEDQRRFQANLLIEMARMSVEDGLVMQLHAGAFRNHNGPLAHRFGPDRGGDIPVATEFTRNLHALLNAHGNDPRLTLVLFTLDESTYSRELAPLAGHYPAVRLGPPWWFHDSMQGMVRYRETTTETAGIWNTAGFNDDTRAFCSIPARHDLSRRVDANYLAGLVARHVIGMEDARGMARALAYGLAKETYRLE